MNFDWVLFCYYVIGYLVTVIFLAIFGKSHLGIDYDSESINEYDDWKSNTQAYTAWSLFWPMVWAVLIMFGVYALLSKVTGFIVKHLEFKQHENIG